MSLLDKIKTPKDIKGLKENELPFLADEIREKITTAVKNNGGHLSSNLGAVDLIVALYYVFDFTEDKLLFDVGHQSYAHKILSGRGDRFDTIRQGGGLCGFPNVFESEYDAFCAGHAGNSISAALGYCTARDLTNKNYYVVDVVGDASFFNGENLEALISNDKKPQKLIIVLNDNGMSISKNNNGLYKFISVATTKKSYGKFMGFANKVFGWNFIGRGLKRIKKAIKVTLNHTTAAESLGFKYVGIFDGHNIKEMIRILNNIKYADKAVVLHLKTIKGKGDVEAENDPSYYHGVAKHLKNGYSSFSSAVSEILDKAIQKGYDITAITAGMKDGTGLSEFEKKYPKKFFDVGIAEEHAVTFAAGQAIGGLKPVVCVYSTFLQRSYDQIMQDVCLQNLPVIFMVDRAGVVGADGATHQGLFDLSYLGTLPNIKVFAPKDKIEMENIFNYCLELNTPCAIRYPNGNNPDFEEHQDVKSSLWEVFGDGDNVILAVGPRMLKLAFAVKEKIGKDICVVNARTVKPLDENLINTFGGKNVITLEENVSAGGFGSAVNLYLINNCINVSGFKLFAFPDKFVQHDTIDNQLREAGLTVDEILKNIK